MADLIYYRVTGGAPLDFCRAFRDGWKATEDGWNDYASTKGGIGHVRLGARRFGGVVFAREPDRADGWKQHSRKCRDGTRFFVPVRSGIGKAAGKALQAEFDALPEGQDAADLCPIIGFPTTVERLRNGERRDVGVVSIFSLVQVAWPDMTDTFFVTLPDVNATIRDAIERGEDVLTPEWQVPDGLEISSRRRYELAQAEAAVRAEEQVPA